MAHEVSNDILRVMGYDPAIGDTVVNVELTLSELGDLGACVKLMMLTVENKDHLPTFEALFAKLDAIGSPILEAAEKKKS